LRNQIAIRKAAAEFEQAASEEQVWECLASLLDQLGFAEAHCDYQRGDSNSMNHFAWRRSSSPCGNAVQGTVPGGHRPCFWTMEIPFQFPSAGSGIVRLGRAFDRRAPLFRMESLVELISQKFALALCTPAAQRAQTAPLPAATPPQLAAAWKAAAGVRR
jgi:hypothetical protein